MRFFTTLLFAFMSALIAKAYDFESNGIYYNILSSTDKTVEVTYKDEINFYEREDYIGDITIPSTIDYKGKTLKVIAIGEQAFYNCNELSSIVLGSNIETIGDLSFYGCSSLKAISLSGKIKSIGNSAFEKCTGLTSLNIPKNIELIDTEAFANCINIVELNFENGVKTLGNSAFSNCDGITKLIIPTSVETIESDCFKSCDNLKSVEIKDTTTVLRLGTTNPFFKVKLDKLYIGRNIGHTPGYYLESLWVIRNVKEYTIGENVTQLDWLASEDVETITLLCATPPTCKAFTEAQYANINLYIPVGTTEVYSKVEPWCYFWNIQEGASTGINQAEVAEDEVEAVYSINGQRCSMSDKGVLILKMKSGKTMKVVK